MALIKRKPKEEKKVDAKPVPKMTNALTEARKRKQNMFRK